MDLDKEKDMRMIAEALEMIADAIVEVMNVREKDEIDNDEENLHLNALLAKAETAVVKGLLVIN